MKYYRFFFLFGAFEGYKLGSLLNNCGQITPVISSNKILAGTQDRGSKDNKIGLRS